MRQNSAALLCLTLLTACGGSGSPTAAPTTAPTPTPAPAASPAVQAFRCPLPAMPDLHNECPKITPRLDVVVESAIQRVIREQPQLFNFNDDRGGGSYLVLDRDKYHQAVVAAIHAQGVCAINEKEEIAVKTSNEFNEQYNIWISDGHLRHGPRAYITTCFPAQF
jgi:hypothetical protein